MKTNLKISSKMHLFIIISSIVIAIGLAVGTICHFAANGFFNYSGSYADYKSITVSYENIDFSGSGKEPAVILEDICDKAFDSVKLSKPVPAYGETGTGGEIVYKFSKSVSSEELEKAVVAINDEIKALVEENGGIQLSFASAHDAETLLGGAMGISRAAIAIAIMLVFHFVYFIIRYRFMMGVGAIIADLHNLALFIALTALFRVPVTSAIATYAVITVLLTVIGTCFLFDRLRKNLKDEDCKKLNALELTDKGANESLMINSIVPACLAALSVVLFIILSISSLSPVAVLAPVACALIACAVSVYGTVFFTPSIYSGFKLLGENKKAAAKTNKTTK